MKFLAIFTSNLDEFFMKRVAVLRQGHTEAERALMRQLRDTLLGQIRRQSDCYRGHIITGLAKHGIGLHRWTELTPAQQEEEGAVGAVARRSLTV